MALHDALRAVVEQQGTQVLHDSDSLARALESHPEAGQAGRAELDLLVETVRWGGLPRVTEAVNQGMDPSSAIAATGEAIARDRGSADVDGSRRAVASLAFAAGHVPESEVVRWGPVPGMPQAPAYGYPPQDAPTGQQPSSDYPGPPVYGYGPADAGPTGRSKSPIIILIAAVLVVALAIGGVVWLLSSDGGDGYDEAAYCDAYQSAQEQIGNLDFTTLDSTQFADLQQQVERLKDLAPPEVQDDWETLEEGLEEFESILEDAGLTFDDLEGLAQGQLPEGVEPSDLTELQTDLTEFTQRGEFQAAGDAVDEDAQTRCN
jgi:hypothetical protein